MVTGEGVVAVSATTTLFIICWQFAQFMLFTQTTAIFGIYLLGVLPQESMHSILVAQVNQGSFMSFSFIRLRNIPTVTNVVR